MVEHRQLCMEGPKRQSLHSTRQPQTCDRLHSQGAERAAHVPSDLKYISTACNSTKLHAPHSLLRVYTQRAVESAPGRLRSLDKIVVSVHRRLVLLHVAHCFVHFPLIVRILPCGIPFVLVPSVFFPSSLWRISGCPFSPYVRVKHRYFRSVIR